MANAITDGTGKQRTDRRPESKDSEKPTAMRERGTELLETEGSRGKKLKR